MLTRASSARPGELTCHFFFWALSMPSPSYGLAFAHLNLLKLELGFSITYLKQTIVKETVNAKDTGLPYSDVLCLFSTGKGQRSVGCDPSPTCIRPYVPVSRKQIIRGQSWPIIVLPWLISTIDLSWLLTVAWDDSVPRYHKICTCMCMYECMNVSNAMILF